MTQPRHRQRECRTAATLVALEQNSNAFAYFDRVSVLDSCDSLSVGLPAMSFDIGVGRIHLRLLRRIQSRQGVTLCVHRLAQLRIGIRLRRTAVFAQPFVCSAIQTGIPSFHPQVRSEIRVCMRQSFPRSSRLIAPTRLANRDGRSRVASAAASGGPDPRISLSRRAALAASAASAAALLPPRLPFGREVRL